MTRKLFISQPMRDKTKQEILNERQALIDLATVKLNGEVFEVIDSYITDFPEDEPIKHTSVWYLGMSLVKLSEADFVIFGDGWQDTPGCLLEHKTCELYNIPILSD